MELRGAKIAVTGATGFLGRYIADALMKRGAKVTGVVRNPGRVPELAARGVEMRKAALASVEELTAGFRGADAVVSNAALFSIRNQRWEDHLRANVDGTRNVFDAVAHAGVKRVVHVSSVAVYRGAGSAAVDESYPQHGADSTRRPWTVYPISKALSEQLAWKMAKQNSLELTAVRPCAIYGAHDPNLMPVLKWLVWPPITLVPALAGMPFVYGGDVAEGIALALEKPVAVDKAYNLTGDDSTIWQFVEAWREAGGKTPRFRLPLPIPITRRFDHRRASQDLGWRNRPLVEGLRETIALEAKEP